MKTVALQIILLAAFAAWIFVQLLLGRAAQRRNAAARPREEATPSPATAREQEQAFARTLHARAAAPAAEEIRARARRIVSPAPPPVSAEAHPARVRDVRELRAAIVAMEILGPPRALRPVELG